MRNRGIRGEQWAVCDRCGRDFPYSMLQPQKGLYVCEDDYDDLEIERHSSTVAAVLSAGESTEGADLRFINDNMADAEEGI